MYSQHYCQSTHHQRICLSRCALCGSSVQVTSSADGSCSARGEPGHPQHDQRNLPHSVHGHMVTCFAAVQSHVGIIVADQQSMTLLVHHQHSGLSDRSTGRDKITCCVAEENQASRPSQGSRTAPASQVTPCGHCGTWRQYSSTAVQSTGGRKTQQHSSQ